MAFCKSQAVSTDQGAWADATAYSVGDGVTFTGLDAISGQGIRFRCIQDHTSESGVIEPTLDPTDAYWRPAHATTALQWFNTILALLKSADFMGADNNWAESYRYDARTHAGTYTYNSVTQPMKRLTVVLRSPDVGAVPGRYYSLTYSEATNAITTRNIRLGAALSWAATPTGSTDTHTFVGAWATSTAYVAGDVVTRATSPAPTHSICIQAHTSDAGKQPGTSGGLAYWHDMTLMTLPYAGEFGSESHYHNEPSFSCWAGNSTHVGLKRGPLFKMWDGGTGDIPFTLVCNAFRAMWAVQSDTFWTFGHVGTLLRFGTPSENPAPIFLLGNTGWQWTATNFAGLRVAYTNTLLRNYPLAQRILSTMLTANADQYQYGNSGYGLTRQLEWKAIEITWPSSPEYARAGGPWRCWPVMGGHENHLSRNPAGASSLQDCLMFHTSSGGASGFHGSLDGIYYVPHPGVVSGNTLDDGTNQYLVIEDVFRGASGGYMALKLA